MEQIVDITIFLALKSCIQSLRRYSCLYKEMWNWLNLAPSEPSGLYLEPVDFIAFTYISCNKRIIHISNLLHPIIV